MNLERFRSYDFDASDMDEVSRTQTPVVIGVGNKQEGKLIVLPYSTYRKVVEKTYGGEKRVAMSPRLSTGTNEGGMTEPALMLVLTRQVGKDGHIQGGQLAVITRRSKDAGFLVPYNDYWKKVVRERTGEG